MQSVNLVERLSQYSWSSIGGKIKMYPVPYGYEVQFYVI